MTALPPEPHESSSETEGTVPPLNVAGLFAGIGGIELGLQANGHHTRLLCEIEPAAQVVLKERFLEPTSPHFEAGASLVPDVRDVVFPPDTELIAAGFPCTDVSQAGRMAGIRGENTGLIQQVFRHLDDQGDRLSNLKWLLLENVPFLLRLDRGEGMRYLVAELEARGFKWAYRIVDSQAFGLPQRRERIFLLASRTEDPRDVLLVDNAQPIEREKRSDTAIGFYWTEGLRGIGWAVDAVPTLKGGSTVGIPSPPAVWLPDGKLMTPDISTAERLQGFAEGWTLPMEEAGYRVGTRWKAIGNAVSVPVSTWIGMRLRSPREYSAIDDESVDVTRASWPRAAWGTAGEVYKANVTSWPRAVPLTVSLRDLMNGNGKPLSARATIGFLERLMRSNLKQRKSDEFVSALVRHYISQGGSPSELAAIPGLEARVLSVTPRR